MNAELINRPRRLPMTVPLVRDETLNSYLARLAAANHLHHGELTDYLNGPAHRPTGHRLDRLGAMTGHPPSRLHDVLAITASRRQRRQACRRCTAARGIRSTVHLAAPAHHPLCRRHRRWLPDEYFPGVHQYDLREVPEILTAHRRHLRLVHHHGPHAADTVADAAYITQNWARRGDWPQHRNRRLRRYLDPDQHWISNLHPLITMVNYPETIALAQLLATPPSAQLAISDDPADVARFNAHVRHRLRIPYQPYTVHDPLISWQHRTRTLHREMRNIDETNDPTKSQ